AARHRVGAGDRGHLRRRTARRAVGARRTALDRRGRAHRPRARVRVRVLQPRLGGRIHRRGRGRRGDRPGQLGRGALPAARRRLRRVAGHAGGAPTGRLATVSRVNVADLELDLEVFSGPFDLLLTLVLREEVDLLEVDLADVVLAYLDFLESRDELDLEV